MKDKKTEIIEKIHGLYDKYGIRSVTMDDVVHELGISKKTLYQYFADKTELVSAVMDRVYETRKQEIDLAMKGNKNAIEEMLTYYALQLKMIKDYKPTMIYDLKKYYPGIYEKATSRKRKNIYDSVLNNLKRGKKEGLYRSELNEEIVARLNLMRVEATMSSGIFSIEEITSAEFFREVFTYHMYGIVNDNGRKLLEKNIDKLL
ncbi:MAG: TetR/AcrR family transcriptional regulator [Chlorobi bacterium]|nr:TetR/AcrR family transcriptional regulator [Chlorobiota bacterium]